MKQPILVIFLCLTTVFQVCGKTRISSSPDSTKYKNEAYGFSVTVPDSWKLYGQVLNDQVNHRAIVDWGLPAIYSELEKTDIENAISITAYKRENINSIDQLILAENSRLNPATTKMIADSANTDARIIHRTVDGLEYKGKSYFVFRNGIGYIINFMATPGTYDKNLAVFEKFYKDIRFQ
jgi:hypothetical protein